MSRCMNGPMGCDFPHCECNAGREEFEAWVRKLWDIGPTRPTDLQGNLWAAWKAGRASAVPSDNGLRELLKEARKIIRASTSRNLAKDWDRRATEALAAPSKEGQ